MNVRRVQTPAWAWPDLVSNSGGVGSEERKLVRFPPWRETAHRNPQRWLEKPLPENVRRIWSTYCERDLPALEPLPPVGCVVLASIEALRNAPARRGRRELDVLGELQEILGRWRDDPQVRYRVGLAIKLMCSRTTGRWRPA